MKHNSHRPPTPLDPIDRSRFPADPWRLVETAYDAADLGLTETLFATSNGYIGLRGNVEEGRDTHTHGTFVNGFHDTWSIRHAEEAYGLARVGQTVVNVPDPKTIKLYVDDDPLLLTTADLEAYERSLDFRDGLLRREVVWRTSSGKRVRIRSTRMTSVVERHLAVMAFEVEMLEGDASLTISSQLLNRQDGSDEYQVRSSAMGEGFDPRQASAFEGRVLDPVLGEVRDDRMLLGYRAHHSRMTVATMVQHQIETDNVYEAQISVSADLGKEVFHIEARQGRPVRLDKIVTMHSSRGVPPQELADRCGRTLDRAVSAGVHQLHAEHAEVWARFWEESDVQVELDADEVRAGPMGQGWKEQQRPGSPGIDVTHEQAAVQQAIRWNLFQLGQATIRAGSHGIAAKGLTGTGYDGHYFWDTECYVLPFLVYTHPQAARNALRFRHGLLDNARRRAAEMAQYGALFPWRTINGHEASAYFAAGTAQYHINADIAYALMKYVRATGDQQFLLTQGVDILVETARLWADLGFWSLNGDQTFHIHGVTGPDEYNTVVNDNLFTNVMAQINLRAAVEAVQMLREDDPIQFERSVMRLGIKDEEIEEWTRAADGMYIPYSAELGIHPQDSQFLEREVWDLDGTPADKRPLLLHYHPLVIYRFQVIKQADVVLALYQAGDRFTPAEKRADFEYYDPITTGDSTLSSVVQSIVAAEVGYEALALRYFYASLFVDLNDRHGNTVDGVHIASTGGVWSSLAAGFGGMRDHGGMLTLDPRLPREWQRLTWRMRWHGSRIRITVERDAVTLTAEVDGPVVASVRGQLVSIDQEGVRVVLEDQGPVIHGTPRPPRYVGAVTEVDDPEDRLPPIVGVVPHSLP